LGFAAAKVAEFIGPQLSDKNIDKFKESQILSILEKNWSKSKRLKTTIGQMYSTCS
jgi:hypothetical protein